ncbi:MAG: pyridoxamine 5'-phosphate oxidase family protein [Rhizobiaceae bacterium]|nr:pyridoxamine 5'-phosphate oxidase family protein [Rhizobiaceae bacterium]MBL4731913.1 pyridoxamine 5'-phosphate oxidase family protein [Rhizobiaceae bacterium]
MATIETAEALRAHFGPASVLALKKQMRGLDKHARHFISLSPFLCIATSVKNGLADNTPRGDAPGFVAVLDDETLLIPERPGNNRLDTLSNLIENPAIGLLFMLPLIRETYRVNGTATIIVDDPRLEDLAVNGRVPAAGILVKISECYFHCGKALLRSHLWNPDTWIDKSDFPTLGEIMADQLSIDQTAAEIDVNLENAYKTKLY